MPPPARTATPAVTAGMLVLSGASVSLPVYGAIRWILSATADVPFESAVATFVAGYPAWLPSPTLITLVNLAACGVAAVAAGVGAQLNVGRARWLARGLFTVAAVLGAWNAFSLM